jgi:hypothetical protein
MDDGSSGAVSEWVVDAREQWWQKGNVMSMDQYLDAEEAGTINTNMNGQEEEEGEEEQEQEEEEEEERKQAAAAASAAPSASGTAGSSSSGSSSGSGSGSDGDGPGILPSGWSAHWDEGSGFYYYQNDVTFESQWEKPLTAEAAAAEMLLKQKQEEEREAEKRKVMNWSHVTGEMSVTQQMLQPLMVGREGGGTGTGAGTGTGRPRVRLTQKLLSRPPFRFLHDVITAVTVTTGFGDGLYTEEQMDAGNITDKAGKMAYLNLMIRCVSIHVGVKVEVRANKIAAGQEVEQTNKFLQFLAIAATNGEPSEYAVRRVKAGADEFDSKKQQQQYT